MASRSWLMPVSTSALASSAPTQKCRPSAKARWSAAAEKALVVARSSRKMSNWSGFA